MGIVSSQPLIAMTMTPITASVPNARRKRSAVPAVRSLARASLALGDLAGRHADEQHRRHHDGLEQQHQAVLAREQLAADLAVELHEPARRS